MSQDKDTLAFVREMLALLDTTEPNPAGMAAIREKLVSKADELTTGPAVKSEKVAPPAAKTFAPGFAKKG